MENRFCWDSTFIFRRYAMNAATKAAGQAISTVDICLTQQGDVVVGLPYTNTAQLPQAEHCAQKVKIVGAEALHVGSKIKKSVTGPPNPGLHGGVISGITNGKCMFTGGSAKVKIEGQAAVRLNDPTSQNSGNCIGTVKTPSQVKVMING